MPISKTVFLGVDVQGDTGNPGGANGLVFDRVSCTNINPSLVIWRQSGAPFGSPQTDFFADGSKDTSAPGVHIVQAPAGAPAGGGCGFTVNQFGIGGVPTALGVYTGNFDASGAFPGDSYTITVSLAGGCPLITITPPEELDDDLVQGATYGLTFTAEDGVAPYSWDVAAGALPPGLALSLGGILSGTPTTLGSYDVTIRAIDDNGCAGVIALTIVIAEPDPIVVNPTSLADGARGWLYVAIITAEEGIGAPYVFTLEDGELPPGVTLSSAGVLAGLPTEAGSFTFTIRATDAADNFGEREYTLVISGLRIVIDGEDVTIEVAAADLEIPLNRQATGHLEIGDGYIPDRGVECLIYARDGITPIFGGLVLSRHVRGMSESSPNNRTDVDLVDFSIYFDDAEVTLTYTTTQDLEDVIAAIVAQSLATYGITYTPTATGITVPPLDWQAITVTDAFKRITDATGVIFRVLPLKALRVFRPLDDPAPVTITDANVNAFDLEWHDPPALPKNFVDLLCGPTGNGIATQQWTADGIETSWEVDIQAVLGNAEPARRANAYLSVDVANFSDGDTIGVGSSTYTFRTALVGDVAGEVLIGATPADSIGNLNAAINLAGGGNYAPSTPANTDCDSFLRAPETIEVDALVAGAAGNAIPVTSSHEAVAFWYGEGSIPRSTLQLGADATGVAGWTQGYVLENGAIARPISGPGGGGYYEWDVTAGRGTISVGTGAVPPNGTLLELKYLAVFPFHARYPAIPPAAPRTFREDHPEIVSYAGGVALAQQIYARESADRRELEVTTDVDGFEPGQELTVDTTFRGGIDDAFLVASVAITLVNAELWEYSLPCQETEEYAGSYVEQWKALTSGGSSAAAPATLVDGGASASGDIYSDGRQSFRADQSMGGNKLRFLDDPTEAQDATTKAYVDAADADLIHADGSVPFTAAQSMGGFALTDVDDPTDPQDAATKAYVDASSPSGVILADGSVPMAAALDMDGNAIENLDDPTNAQDAATKAYVDAAAPGAGGLVLLASLTASSSSSLDFVNRNASGQSGAIFQSDFDEYLIEFVNVRPATNAAGILGRLSTDGGSTYASTSYYSPYHVVWSGGHTAGNDTTNGFRVSGPCSNTAANGGVSGTMRLYNPLSSVVHKQALLSTANVDTNVSVPVRWDVGAAYQSATACDAFRVIATSGNIADGTVRIYGIKK